MRSKEKSVKKISVKRDKIVLSPRLKRKENAKSGLDQNFPVRRHSAMATRSTQLKNNEQKTKNNKEINIFNSALSSKQMKSLQKQKTTTQIQQSQYENEKTEKYSVRYLAGGLALAQEFTLKKNYQYLTMVGKGGFGKVWKVEHLPSGKIFALKEMSKATIIGKRSVESIINERNLLSSLKHEFLVNMVYAFQDRTHLYLLMDLKGGGDLRYHLAKKHSFSELQTRFLIGGIILALEYMHKKMVIHRDVKPQNIVFDEGGYAHLTDLGIAKYLKEGNDRDTSGTPGYMAPEVMFHNSHRFEVDFYALGVIVYEIIMKKRPYVGKDRQEIKEMIKKKQVIIAKDDIPEGWTIESADFVNKLLQRRPMKRLGWGGVEELKEHRWLRNFPWKEVLEKSIQSPFKQKYNPHEVRYRPTEHETHFKKLLNKNKQMLAKGKLQDNFDGYTYQGVLESQVFCQSTYLN